MGGPTRVLGSCVSALRSETILNGRNISPVDVFETPGEEISSLAPAWSL